MRKSSLLVASAFALATSQLFAQQTPVVQISTVSRTEGRANGRGAWHDLQPQ